MKIYKVSNCGVKNGNGVIQYKRLDTRMPDKFNKKGEIQIISRL